MNFAQIRSLSGFEAEQGDEAARMFRPAVHKPSTGQYGTLAGVTEDGQALVEFGGGAEPIPFSQVEAA